MIRTKLFPLLIAGLLLGASPAVLAQEGKKDKKEKEYKEKEYDKKEYKGKKDKKDKKFKDKDRDDVKDRYEDKDKYEGRERDRRYDDGRTRDRRYEGDDDRRDRDRRAGQRNEGRGGILGKVILPPAGSGSPRQLQGVPKGHYPPPGQCRIWYPNRPPGHQPAPTGCDNLRGIRLEPGAFVLHGDRAYDAEYDWREEDRRRPGTVSRDILDILFPNR